MTAVRLVKNGTSYHLILTVISIIAGNNMSNDTQAHRLSATEPRPFFRADSVLPR